MLQDLTFGRLENEFHDQLPNEEDIVICFHNNELLLKRGEDRSICFPSYAEVVAWAEEGSWNHWFDRSFQYVFRMQEKNYFLWLGTAGREEHAAYHFEQVRTLRELAAKDMCYAAMTAWHLYVWYRNNRFCGCCGSKTLHDAAERMLRCPDCGNMIFPRISPAVIVAITDGDRLLMSKYAGRSYTHYALLAGFTEIGETLEQTVLTIPGVTEISGFRISAAPAVEIINTPDTFTVHPKGTMILRGRQSGDSIRLHGGSKSLKKLFIDRKIPAADRDRIPVLCDNAGVLGVYGIGVHLDRAAKTLPAVTIHIEKREKGE